MRFFIGFFLEMIFVINAIPQNVYLTQSIIVRQGWGDFLKKVMYLVCPKMSKMRLKYNIAEKEISNTVLSCN